MISKDLLYTLQNRNKQMIRALDDFSGNIRNHSMEEAWTVITETIKLVKELSPAQGKYNHIIKAVNRAWLAFCEQSETAANHLYDTVISTLEDSEWTHADEAQIGYQLIYAFHNNHLRFPGPNTYLHIALRQHSPRLLDLIRKIAAYSTQKLFTTPVKPHTGSGADAIDMLLEIYFYHAGLNQSDDLRAEAARLIPALVQINPATGNNITLSLLQHCPERASIVSQLIEHYIITGVHENSDGMFFDMMLELLDNSGDSFMYDDLDKISAQIEISSQRWNDKQFDIFTHYAFFYGLKSNEDRILLLRKSKKVRRLAKMIVDSKHAGTDIDTLRSLYQSISSPAPDATSTTAGVHQFTDLHFKLLVIQELMYVQKKLLPRFDIDEFIKQYTARDIMMEKDGYAVIPEALAYFEGLLIPLPLLTQVEKLAFDGSNEVYRQIFPHWDGECGSFDVTSPEDVKLLPHLKYLSGMPSLFIEKYGAELNKKLIQVD